LPARHRLAGGGTGAQLMRLNPMPEFQVWPLALIGTMPGDAG